MVERAKTKAKIKRKYYLCLLINSTVKFPTHVTFLTKIRMTKKNIFFAFCQSANTARVENVINILYLLLLLLLLLIALTATRETTLECVARIGGF